MRALIIVDMQNDFIDGSLAVPGAKEIINPINKIIDNYDFVVATQDWHPKKHISFASRFNIDPFSDHNGEIKWPDHCVQNTKGAEITKKLKTEKINLIIRKGYNDIIDSYSAFEDSIKRPSGLHSILSPYYQIHVCGLASDYCVYHTLLSGVNLLPDNRFAFLSNASKFVDESNKEIVYRTFNSLGVSIL